MDLIVKGEGSDIKQMYLQIVVSPMKKNNETFLEHLARALI